MSYVEGKLKPPTKSRKLEFRKKRVEGDFNRCFDCRKMMSRAEAHSNCMMCRSRETPCPKNCKPCIVNEEKWRVALLNKNFRYHEKMQALRAEHLKFSRLNKSQIDLKAKKNLSISKNLKESLLVTQKVDKSCEVSLPKVAKSDKLCEKTAEFEDLLLDSYPPGSLYTLPSQLIHKNAKLAEIPPKLKMRFLNTRNYLTRLIAISSISGYYAQSMNLKAISKLDGNGVGSLFSSLIRHKANELGLIIFEMRKYMLSTTVAPNPEMLEELVYGEIKPGKSIFGNVENLSKLCSKHPGLKLKPGANQQCITLDDSDN